MHIGLPVLGKLSSIDATNVGDLQTFQADGKRHDRVQETWDGAGDF